MKRLVFSAALLVMPLAILAQDADLLPPGQKLDKKPPQRILDAVNGVKTHGIGAVAISPDGARVAWVSRGPHGSRVEISELAGMGSGKSLSAGAPDKDCDTGTPNWSPDGKTLAVLSDCGDGKQQQIFLSKDGGALKPLGSLKGYIDDLRWAPDGSAMTLLYTPNASGPTGATSVQRWPEGIIGPNSGNDLQRLATVSLRDASVKLISPESLHIYEYSWAHDGGSVVYTAAPPPGENNWWVAKLYAQPIGGETRVILDPGTATGDIHGLQMAVPTLSPDGTQVAFIGGLMSDFGSTGGDVYAVPAAGGPAANLTPAMRSTAVWVHWMDNQTVGFSDTERGESSFRTVAVTGGDQKVLYRYAGSFGSGTAAMSVSFSDKNNAAFTRSSITDPPEVWAESGSDPQQVTHLNSGAATVGGKTESFTWKSGGYDVQGFVTYPSPYDPKQKYPMIVNVHGGPAASVANRWSGGRGVNGVYSLAGYFIFEPNDRGSYGQGEAFVQANRKDFGYGDLKDALAGVDALEARLPIDDHRIGLTGGSYGGFMSMFAPTQTSRFAASVAVAGISDWLSYYGENSIDQWMIPYFGASVYDDPAVYAKQSAITFIKQEKTPMLIIVGDRDGECPAPQSFEMWHALRDLRVPTELVVYPNEGHGLSQPAHQLDYMERSLEWFAKYMPAPGAKS